MGNDLMDTLVKTRNPIPYDATQIHGITDADFVEYLREIRHAFHRLLVDCNDDVARPSRSLIESAQPRLLQAILGSAAAALTAWIGARQFGPRVGLAAGIVTACYGTLTVAV